MENATERVSRIGPGAEALRRIHVQRLRSHMDAFYEHGSVADVLLLSTVFDEAERSYGGGNCGIEFAWSNLF
jgi:hypothetical protein